MKEVMQLIDKYAELGAYASEYADKLKAIENGTFSSMEEDIPFTEEYQSPSEINNLTIEFERVLKEKLLARKNSVEQMQLSVSAKIDAYIESATSFEKEELVIETSTKVAKMYEKLNELDTVILVSKLLGDEAFTADDLVRENEENQLYESYIKEKKNINAQLPFYTETVAKLGRDVKKKKISNC